MKILKIVLLSIGGIIALLLIIALFMKKDFAIEREVTINKTKPEVFAYLLALKNQDKFSVWAMKDPNMKKTYTGADSTVGFVSAWDSENGDVGKGEQEIKKITPGERIDYELRFIKPFESTNNAYMATEAVTENQTKVKWGFHGKMVYPTNIMPLFCDMDKMLGKDLETGLTNLKGILEK
jgi:uncharacterized protein YndB with AHSA1/START domain